MIPFWIGAAFVLTLVSGVPGLFLKRGSTFSQRIATVLHVIGCAAGLAAVLMVFCGGIYDARFAWPLPGGVIAIHIDMLAAFFLLPVFVVMAAGSIYGEGYWAESAHPSNGRKLRFFYGALTAGFVLVLIAGDAWSFLVGWEIVGLAAFFLVLTESDQEEPLRAGWIYLIATHVATLLLFAMFGAMRNVTGTWLFQSPIAISTLTAPILLLAIAGFGIKAGLMPFHVWLPEAHAAAPSHVSAVLSGVVLKMGVYGLVRVMSLFLEIPSWFGMLLLFAGITSGILGVVFALVQHDLKRLLAYHSIENIGIIFIGLGVAMLGRNEKWGILALAGSLLHVWNHAFFKALLFFAAGAVVHATGTRSIDAMGGLLRKMRTTGISFLVGAVAISGLPPLNGFVSEWLIYIAGFKTITGTSGSAAATAATLSAPALALIGALAVACFVKAFSVVFLGSPRSTQMQQAHEAPLSMRLAMVMLVVVCFVIGIWPLTVYAPLSNLTANVLGHQEGIAEIYGLFSTLPVASFVALALLGITTLVIAIRTRHRSETVTWDCGYARPTARMQYTSSSFASPLAGLFRWALRPDVHKTSQASLFPADGTFESHVPDPVLERLLVPGMIRGRRMMAFARFIQAGRIQVYILYIIATLLILLTWSAL